MTGVEVASALGAEFIARPDFDRSAFYFSPGAYGDHAGLLVASPDQDPDVWEFILCELLWSPRTTRFELSDDDA